MVARERVRSFAFAAGAAAMALGLAATRPAGAQTTPDAADHPPTVLQLSEHAQRMLPRDRLRVELRAEATDTDPRRLQEEINRRMTAAVARAKEVPGITLTTTGYGVFQERAERQPARWRGSEGLSLVGRDFAALLGLAGALQEQGLVMTGLAADLSREAARSVEDELAGEAVARIGERAGRIAAALGMSVAGYRSLRVGNVAVPSLPLRAMAAAGAPAAPVAEPGEATVALEVEAEVLLRR
jgi:predicted secreted protein